MEKSKYEIGQEGVNLVETFCKENNIKFHKASDKQDLQLGIDCYINNKPTDVKNTNDIYFLKFKYDKFIVRHPFNVKSEATHYFFVNEKTGEYNFTPIHGYLIMNYFGNLASYIKFIQILGELNMKNINQTFLQSCYNNKQAFYVLKLRLSELLMEDVKLSYSYYNDGFSFRLIKQKK